MDYLLVVSDCEGFVGAFSSAAKAKKELASYLGLPLAVSKQPYYKDKQDKLVWVLPYLENNAVAFASNNKKEVERVQNVLLKVSLVPEESVEYWEQEIDTISIPAKKRMDAALQNLKEENKYQFDKMETKLFEKNRISDYIVNFTDEL